MQSFIFEHVNMLILYDGQGFDMWTHVHVLFIVSTCNKRVISESVVYLCLNFAHETKHLGFNHHLCFLNTYVFITPWCWFHVPLHVFHILDLLSTCSSIFSQPNTGLVPSLTVRASFTEWRWGASFWRCQSSKSHGSSSGVASQVTGLGPPTRNRKKTNWVCQF